MPPLTPPTPLTEVPLTGRDVLLIGVSYRSRRGHCTHYLDITRTNDVSSGVRLLIDHSAFPALRKALDDAEAAMRAFPPENARPTAPPPPPTPAYVPPGAAALRAYKDERKALRHRS